MLLVKRYLLLLLLPATACHPDQPTTTGQPATPATPADQPAASLPAFTPPTGPLRSGDTTRPTDHDTLHVPGGSVLYLKPSTAGAWAKAPAQLAADVDKQLTNTGRVRRVGRELLLQPEHGALVTFVTRLSDDPGPDDAVLNQAKPIYLGELPQAHLWVVETMYMDKSVTTLVDQHTGRRTDVTGRPAVSPDGQLLLSTRSDQGNDGSDQSDVGTQLYQLTPAGPRLLWTRLTQYWGSHEARWLGPRTLLLKQDYEPANQEASPPPETYVQVELPR